MKFKFKAVENEVFPKVHDYLIVTADESEAPLCRVFGPDAEEFVIEVLDVAHKHFSKQVDGKGK